MSQGVDGQVCCSGCVYFSRDTVGLGDGIGECAVFDALPVRVSRSVEGMRRFGVPVFYPNALRFCEFFASSVG